jgi:hypothetical protein
VLFYLVEILFLSCVFVIFGSWSRFLLGIVLYFGVWSTIPKGFLGHCTLSFE